MLKAVLAGLVRRPDEPAFAAAVAYYPGCDSPASPLETDTLILIGDADDWTPAARCARWRDTAPWNGPAFGEVRPSRIAEATEWARAHRESLALKWAELNERG